MLDADEVDLLLFWHRKRAYQITQGTVSVALRPCQELERQRARLSAKVAIAHW